MRGQDQVTVRLARPTDVDAIVDVHMRSSSAAYAQLPASVLSVSREVRRARWAEALVEPDSHVWVADDTRRIVGFCHLRVFPATGPEAGTAEIVSLYIDPAHWRQGAGRSLIETARTFAAERGCTRLFLKVYAENGRARAAYEAMGFAAAPGSTVHARTGLLLREYRMPLA